MYKVYLLHNTGFLYDRITRPEDSLLASIHITYISGHRALFIWSALQMKFYNFIHIYKQQNNHHLTFTPQRAEGLASALTFHVNDFM